MAKTQSYPDTPSQSISVNAENCIILCLPSPLPLPLTLSPRQEIVKLKANDLESEIRSPKVYDVMSEMRVKFAGGPRIQSRSESQFNWGFGVSI